MSPEDRAAIEQVIKATVNGKIDHLTKEVEEMKHLKSEILQTIQEHNRKHDEDMQQVKDNIAKTTPIVEGLEGARVLGGALKWLAGIVAAWILIKEVLIKTVTGQ